MRALIRKELRENLVLAAIALVIATMLLFGAHTLYAATVKVVLLGRWASSSSEMLQPLLSQTVLVCTSGYCALFCVVLGWLQIRNEQPRDLWAFFIHKPLSPTALFLGKSLAGLGLYFMVVGVPLTLAVLWLRVVGRPPTLFDWTMILPLAANFLAGIVWYYAGMLVGLRQARWYASRGLPLLAALLVSGALAEFAGFWQALGAILLAVGALGVACWGGFRGDVASDEGRPALARLGLIGSVGGGAFLLAIVATGMLMHAAIYVALWQSWSAYTVTRDGTIYKSVRQGNGPVEIQQLDGRPVADAATGQAVEVRAFNRRLSEHLTVRVDFDPASEFRRHFQHANDYFFGWRMTPDTAWYFSRRHERLVGVDLVSRRVIGSLGPDGFVAGVPRVNSAHFQEALGISYRPDSREQLLSTKTAIYRVNVDQRSSAPLFTTAVDDPIGGFQSLFHKDAGVDKTLVVTKRYVQLLNGDGTLQWKVPYQAAYPEYGMVQVYFIEEPTVHYVLWMFPSEEATLRSGRTMPIRATWLGEKGEIERTAELPVLGQRFSEHVSLVNVLRPAVTPAPNPAVARAGMIDWRAVLVALAAAGLVFLPLTLWLGRRYALPGRSLLGWSLFVLACGFPAFIAFLSVHDWPARAPCPNCRRPRVVNRDQCEHCGAGFPPPERTGIEIFEAA